MSRMMSSSRKKLWIKAQGLQLTENQFPLARMKDSLRLQFYWTEKLLSFESVSEKNEEKGFH